MGTAGPGVEAATAVATVASCLEGTDWEEAGKDRVVAVEATAVEAEASKVVVAGKWVCRLVAQVGTTVVATATEVAMAAAKVVVVVAG